MATNKKRLELESTKTANDHSFEEHKEHHTRILMDLERQKQKMERSLRRIQESKESREQQAKQTGSGENGHKGNNMGNGSNISDGNVVFTNLF